MPKKLFITGSTDGLGFMAAERLLKHGHQVVAYACHEAKAEAVLKKLPDAAGAIISGVSSITQTKALANAVNKYGRATLTGVALSKN